WPGLGQWYAGRVRTAVVYAVPVAIVLVAIAAQLLEGLTSFALQLIDPSVALTMLVLIVLLATWRLLSMVDALGITGGGRQALRTRAGGILAGLSLVVLVSHAVLGYYAWSFYDAGSRIFVGEPGVDETPAPSVLDPSADPEYEATPHVTPGTRQSRITILLTGIDAAPTRTHALTDTLLVLSVDPNTGDGVMVSFPRDIAQFPLWDGRTFNGKINSLMTYARNHPAEFPDGPLPSLIKELGFLLGTPIHYYAAVDLGDFEALIDSVGGVTVNVERRIADARYDWLDGSPNGFFLSAGTHTLNGRLALAYVRSRQGAGDNDFVRAARQQQLILALREKLTDPAMLPKLPEVLDIAADAIRTNFPPDRIDEMLELARGVEDGSVQRFVLRPPRYSIHPPTNTTGGTYILRLKLDEIRRLSIELFGSDSRYWTEDPR
ncbi:MAG: LCP family protein, partial [Chloroflexi bacterium]|nr:LCP family protein [Chloroflexota bacterium]